MTRTRPTAPTTASPGACVQLLETLLWSSVCLDDANGDAGVTFAELGYTPDDVTPSAAGQLVSEFEEFLTSFDDVLWDAYVAAGGSQEQAAHDFILTRNRHGAGFWDRGMGELGEYLTRMAHPYGETNPYVSDGMMISLD